MWRHREGYARLLLSLPQIGESHPTPEPVAEEAADRHRDRIGADEQ